MRFFIQVLLLLLPYLGFAQIDQEFYLAVPYITPQHADRPVFLHLTSYDTPVTVTLRNAYTEGLITTVVLPAFSASTVNLTGELENLSCAHNQVLNNGLKITATAEITAYYEVYGSSPWGGGVNSEIFVLKGKKALGKDFYIPFQTHWNNYAPVDAWSSFDIVATENNTSVTIVPTQDLLGHAAGVPFTLTLQKGQTYSARSLSNLGSLHPVGTHVTSDKPIAITLKHDSILEDVNYDIAGDQLVPVEHIGFTYTALKLSAGGNYDRLFITATQPNTLVYAKGSSTPVATLANAGDSFAYQIDIDALYLESSAPVYVFQVGGFGKELAGALLPPLLCTGSRDVRFTRANEERLGLMIIVAAGGEDDFVLNGNASLITASQFAAVPGNAALMYALVDLDESVVSAGSASRLSNSTTDFQLGFANGVPEPTGFRLGVLSDYGGVELGANALVCEGNSFRFNAGYGKDSYLWTPGLETTQHLVARDSGWYKVEVSKGTCTYKDSVRLDFYPPPARPVLGADTSICANATPFTISLLNAYQYQRWNTGAEETEITVSDSGTYIVSVTNEFGCTVRDSLHLAFYAVPDIAITTAKLGRDFCDDSLVSLEVTPGYPTYLWYNGAVTTSISVPHTADDYYQVAATTTEGCTSVATWQTDCSIYIGLIPNLITPNNDQLNDNLFVESLDPGKWSLEIYDRWGARIYYNSSYNNDWSPQNIPADIYFYRLYHNFKDELEYKGWIQVAY